jgi:hypothetical protein
MSGIFMSQIAGTYATVASTADPYFANVVLLMHFDSTPGLLVDSSSIGATCTTTGTVSNGLTAPIASVSPQSGFGNGLLSLGTTSSAILVPGNAGFGWATGVDFTIECWLYKKTANALRQLAGQWLDAAPIYAHWTFYMDTNGRVNFQASTNATNVAAGNKVGIVTSTSIPANAWSHIAISRSGTTTKIFINGAQGVSSPAMNFAIPFDPTYQLGIGKNNSQNTFAMDTSIGYIDEFRITNGVARYTANFTPPSQPFSNS